MPFVNDLLPLCATQMTSAIISDCPNQKAEVVQALATTLGRVIAMATEGESKAMDDLFQQVDTHMTREAVGFSQTVFFASTAKRAIQST